MLTLATYRIKPFILHGTTIPEMQEYPAEWLRMNINALMNRRKGSLKKNDVQTDSFHNHDEIKGTPINRYPPVIYHIIDSAFYATGINRGVKDLQELVKQYLSLIEINTNCYLKFEIFENEHTFEVENTQEKRAYSLTDWLPFNNQKNEYNDFLKIKSISDKIIYLEKTLQRQITDDFNKYFNIDLNNTSLNILDVDSFNRPWIKHISDKEFKHVFQPFTIQFEANIKLPPLITFGNCKAFGNGRLSKASIKQD